VPSPLVERICALETEADLIKKQLLARNRREWNTMLARLKVVYSDLEQCYAALAVECYSQGAGAAPAKKDNVPDCTDSAA
jgi:hypothetical protein